ncbi:MULTISPECIES: hypothetical protein [Enterococcus]|uniref:HicB family protein n=1 Tax=Enterococcus alishanensis TaxID=1303817 RepID=A0ABS6TDB6_9ENTE|nr:hypothetical protein [Enterococcus alishanensis]MBV7390881.1 hypothetical protein [Enterococcus alishanensis]
MTFSTQDLTYRVTLDTENNLFIVYIPNSDHRASGVTIEEAISKLKKTA